MMINMKGGPDDFLVYLKREMVRGVPVMSDTTSPTKLVYDVADLQAAGVYSPSAFYRDLAAGRFTRLSRASARSEAGSAARPRR